MMDFSNHFDWGSKFSHCIFLLYPMQDEESDTSNISDYPTEGNSLS